MDTLTSQKIARKKGTPRHPDTYRAQRRNAIKKARMLPQWRAVIAFEANKAANLHGRAVQANAAREAAAKALIGNRQGRPDIVAAESMLIFYRGEPRTRVVNRIIRSLERQAGVSR